MNHFLLCCGYAVAACALAPLGAAAQSSILVPDAAVVDMAYDTARHVLFVSGGPKVLRYDMDSGKFLAPIVLGGQTWGMDISADGKWLAVANRSRGARQVFIDLVPLATVKPTRIGFERTLLEGGTNDVAFDRLGYLLISGSPDYGATPLPPLRRYNRVTGQTQVIGQLSGEALLAPSGDHEWIAIAEENNTGGPWGVYKTSDASYLSRHFLNHEASDVGISSDGAQVTMSSSGSAYVFDDFTPFAVIGAYPHGPFGVAYSPTKPSVYFPVGNTNTVAEYNTATMTQIDTFTVPGTFANDALFGQGRSKVSSDGRWLFTTLATGVAAVPLLPTR